MGNRNTQSASMKRSELEQEISDTRISKLTTTQIEGICAMANEHSSTAQIGEKYSLSDEEVWTVLGRHNKAKK